MGRQVGIVVCGYWGERAWQWIMGAVRFVIGRTRVGGIVIAVVTDGRRPRMERYSSMSPMSDRIWTSKG